MITGWEVADPKRGAAPERIRQLNLARELHAAGFDGVDVRTRPEWMRLDRAHREAARRLDVEGDPGLASLSEEAEQLVPQLDDLRRVLAIGRAP